MEVGRLLKMTDEAEEVQKTCATGSAGVLNRCAVY